MFIYPTPVILICVGIPRYRCTNRYTNNTRCTNDTNIPIMLDVLISIDVGIDVGIDLAVFIRHRYCSVS